MQPHTFGPAVLEFPSELELVVTRKFSAPMQLVFDAFTKPELVRKTIAPFDEKVTECSIDLRVGGNYRYTFETGDGRVCSFRGTYLEVDAPTRTVETWLFNGWPDAEAVESIELREGDGVTKLTLSLTFRDKAGRDHMTKYDGLIANLDNVEALLRSLAG